VIKVWRLLFILFAMPGVSVCTSAPGERRDVTAPVLYAFPIAGARSGQPRIPVFSADGMTLIFSMGEPSQIYVSTRRDGAWSAPEPASFSDAGANFEPFLMGDQRTLLFGSTRSPGREPGVPRTWRTTLQSDGAWSAPELLIATESDTGIWYANGPSLDQIYFSGELPGAMGASDLWVIDTRTARARPQRLPAPLNSEHIEWDPYLTPGGDAILFASDRPGGYGRVDLYVSFRLHDGWTTPRNLGGAINTPSAEVATAISPDGRTLFFVREPNQVFAVSTDVIERLRPGGASAQRSRAH
jgi:hypothetical protein